MDKSELATEFGISKTVYSLVYRETEAIEAQCRAEMPRELYGEPWTGKQDEVHEEFFHSWANIMGQPVTGFGFHKMRALFPHYYPTSGSSEAIREVIAQISAYAPHRHRECPWYEGVILVFEGEYEGYRAYAQSYNIHVIEIPRDNYEEALKQAVREYAEGFACGESLEYGGGIPHFHFFLSQPSSIDGNVWDGYDRFLEVIEEANGVIREVYDNYFGGSEYPESCIKIHLDLCYVGCTNGIEYKVNLVNKNIETVFFSLSKVYGVYYHRIGGVWSRKKLDALWGNRWFKNLFSLYFGTVLMNELGYDFGARYAGIQARAVKALSEMNAFKGIVVEPSDVILLANSTIGKFSNEIQREFKRSSHARFCLTPGMSAALSIPEQRLSTDPFGVSS